MKLQLLLLLAAISAAHSYHILVSFIMPSHSHNQLGRGVVDALLKGGHTVTWITPYPEKVGKNPPKTLNVVGVSHVQHYGKLDMSDSKNMHRGIAIAKELAKNVTLDVFTDPAVQNVIVNTQFDAVVTELFFSDAMAGLAAVQKVPWILMSTAMMPYTEAQVDDVRSAHIVPHIIMPDAGIPMTLKERIISVGISAMITIESWFEYSDTVEFYQTLFGPLAHRRNVELPPFPDAYYNVSILLVNTHESIYPTFSVPPNVVNIAGYHIDENPPPLPKDLQDLLDKSKQGVVYFSMGSVLRSAALKPHTRKALIAKFVDMSDSKNMHRGIAIAKELAKNVTLDVFTDPAVQNVIVNTQFDAVVTELFFSDAMAGLAAVQKVPWILMSTAMMPYTEAQVDDVRSAHIVPHIIMPDAGIPMTLKERIISVGISAMITIESWFEYSDTVEFYQTLFGPLAHRRNVELPPFPDAYYNVSILLVNTHESIYPTFSVPPNVVNIAGYHIDENPPPLPKDLQDLLDKSKQGVVYFSMGSVLRSAALKPHTRKALIAKFGALPYTVLWKYEEPIEEELPPNVHVRKWLPQPTVLIHPNVKVFITHGGQLSSLEALQAGVPLLSVPVFGDQPGNAERARRHGYALKVPFGPDMADELDEKLREILTNPKYTERVKYLSQLFRDRPVPPAKLLTHYVELAIKTKGAYHLRSSSLQYSWIQRWMLDLLLLALAALTLILTVVTLVVRIVCRKFCSKTCSAKKIKTN